MAKQGGAITLHDGSKLILNEPLKADFISNHATDYGGALFLEDSVTTFSRCDHLQLLYNDQYTCFF